MTAGQYKNMTWVGIYWADGDTLTWNGGWKTEIATVPSISCSRWSRNRADHATFRDRSTELLHAVAFPAKDLGRTKHDYACASGVCSRDADSSIVTAV
jgi:hypothetical protein